MSTRVSVATAVNVASLQDRNVVAGPGAAVGPICRLVRYVGGAVRDIYLFYVYGCTDAISVYRECGTTHGPQGRVVGD